MGAGIIGFEVDFGTTPNFFQNTTGDGNFEYGDGYVTTLHGQPHRRRADRRSDAASASVPTASAGIGLLRSSIDGGGLFDEVSSSDLGFNAGPARTCSSATTSASAAMFATSARSSATDDAELGLDIEDFDFWRGTVGVTFRFGR